MVDFASLLEGAAYVVSGASVVAKTAGLLSDAKSDNINKGVSTAIQLAKFLALNHESKPKEDNQQ